MRQALEKALDFEKEGYEFYKKIAAEMQNPLAKRLFESLAEQENEHMKRIKEIYGSLNFDVDSNHFQKAASIEEELKKLFFELEESRRKMPLDHMEGYKLAMEMEKKGYNMYREFAQSAASESERKFFEALIQEEKEHLNSLDNVYRFLTETPTWYSEEESRVWNWMNM